MEWNNFQINLPNNINDHFHIRITIILVELFIFRVRYLQQFFFFHLLIKDHVSNIYLEFFHVQLKLMQQYNLHNLISMDHDANILVFQNYK